MPKNKKDDDLAARTPAVLNHHQTMLSDDVRNGLLYRALEASIGPNSDFLDIGAGTGVWSIAAAKLGAKRVVAIELEEALIPIIRKHAEENRVADRIEIIHGRSDDVKLRGRFDVIVCELFGSDAFGADSINSFIDVRKRFLAPGGTLIPQKLSMFAVPARISEPVPAGPTGLSISGSFFRSIRLNYGRKLSFAEHELVEFLEKPKALVEVDFRSVHEPPNLVEMSASWDFDRIDEANAIVTFSGSEFSPEIVLDSFRSRSWGTIAYEFEPFGKRSGTLSFEMTIDGQKGNWSVGVQGDRTQSFSPVFAFTRLRMAQATTPHKKARAKKAKKT
jgi:SAM-dependent methyltransferase